MQTISNRPYRTLNSFAQTVRRAPLTDDVDGHRGTADVAIIDARSDPAAAQAVCRRLTTDSPAIAVVALVAPADCVAVDVRLATSTT